MVQNNEKRQQYSPREIPQHLVTRKHKLLSELNSAIAKLFSWEHSVKGFEYWLETYKRIRDEMQSSKGCEFFNEWDKFDTLQDCVSAIHRGILWEETHNGVHFWSDVASSLKREREALKTDEWEEFDKLDIGTYITVHSIYEGDIACVVVDSFQIDVSACRNHRALLRLDLFMITKKLMDYVKDGKFTVRN